MLARIYLERWGNDRTRRELVDLFAAMRGFFTAVYLPGAVGGRRSRHFYVGSSLAYCYDLSDFHFYDVSWNDPAALVYGAAES
jgi:hypothetical protein